MVAKSNLKQNNYFCNCFARNMLVLSKYLQHASGVKRVSHNNLDFFYCKANKKQETTKTIKRQLFASPEKLERYCKEE